MSREPAEPGFGRFDGVGDFPMLFWCESGKNWARTARHARRRGSGQRSADAWRARRSLETAEGTTQHALTAFWRPGEGDSLPPSSERRAATRERRVQNATARADLPGRTATAISTPAVGRLFRTPQILGWPGRWAPSSATYCGPTRSPNGRLAERQRWRVPWPGFLAADTHIGSERFCERRQPARKLLAERRGVHLGRLDDEVDGAGRHRR